MYWLIGSLIIIVMMGVLAVADSMPMPVSTLFLEANTAFTLPLLLTVLTIILLFVNQRYTPFAHPFNGKKPFSQSPSVQKFAKIPSYTVTLLSKFTHYLLVLLLALAPVSYTHLRAHET